MVGTRSPPQHTNPSLTPHRLNMNNTASLSSPVAITCAVTDLRTSVTAQESNKAQLLSDLSGLDSRIRDLTRDLELERITAVELESAVCA